MNTARWLLVAALGTTACGPTAGDLVLALRTPNNDDGAILFSVTASDERRVLDVRAECAGCQVFAEVISEQEIVGVITGDLADGPFVRLMVSDIGRPDGYTFRFEQVATRDLEVRQSTSGYSVSSLR